MLARSWRGGSRELHDLEENKNVFMVLSKQLPVRSGHKRGRFRPLVLQPSWASCEEKVLHSLRTAVFVWFPEYSSPDGDKMFIPASIAG